MHRVTLVFILFLLIPDLYIYLVYVVRKTRKTFLRSLYWLPTLLLAAGYVYFMFLTGDNAMSNHTQAIGRLAITIMLFVFPKTIFMLCSLVGVLAHFIIRRCPRSPFTAIGLVLAVVSFFNILYFCRHHPFRYERSRISFCQYSGRFRRLPHRADIGHTHRQLAGQSGTHQTIGRFSQRTEAGPDCLHR